MSSSQVLQDMRRAQDSYRSGVWVGRVESLEDPEQMNRIRVRVLMIHGEDDQTPTKALPWAEIADMFGGGFDFGSGGLVFPIGSTVWVMFEMGDERFPIVIGGRRGKIKRNDNNPQKMLTNDSDTSPVGDKTWKPPEDNELPKDIFEEDGAALHPTRTVWMKSFKGHTIMVEDGDEKEFLRIIDRAGQTIEMSCPVSSSKNEDNAEQRGVRTSIKDDQVEQDSLVESVASIRIKDIAGQEILMFGKKEEEAITITSRNRDESSVQKVTISSKKDEEFILMEDKDGNHLLLDTAAGLMTMEDKDGNLLAIDAENELIAMQDKSGNKIEIDTGGEVATIDMSGNVVLVKGDLIELGADGAGDSVPLDSLVQEALVAAADGRQVTADEGTNHVHPLGDFLVPLLPLGPVSVLAVNLVPAPATFVPTVPFTDAEDPPETASELVTIDS